EIADEPFLARLIGDEGKGAVIDRLLAVVADHLLDDYIVAIAQRQRLHADVRKSQPHFHRNGEFRISDPLHRKIAVEDLGSGEAVVGERKRDLAIELLATIETEIKDRRIDRPSRRHTKVQRARDGLNVWIDERDVPLMRAKAGFQQWLIDRHAGAKLRLWPIDVAQEHGHGSDRQLNAVAAAARSRKRRDIAPEVDHRRMLAEVYRELLDAGTAAAIPECENSLAVSVEEKCFDAFSDWHFTLAFRAVKSRHERAEDQQQFLWPLDRLAALLLDRERQRQIDPLRSGRQSIDDTLRQITNLHAPAIPLGIHRLDRQRKIVALVCVD